MANLRPSKSGGRSLGAFSVSFFTSYVGVSETHNFVHAEVAAITIYLDGQEILNDRLRTLQGSTNQSWQKP